MDEVSMGNLTRLLANSPGNAAIWKQFLLELSSLLKCEMAELLVNDLSVPGRHRLLYGVNIETDLKKKNACASADFRQFVAAHPYLVSSNQNINELHCQSVETGLLFSFGIAIPCNQRYVVSLLVTRLHPFNSAETTQTNQVLQNILEPLESAIQGEQRHKIKNQLSHFLGHHFDSYIVVDDKLKIVFSDPIDVSIIQQMDCVSIKDKQFSLNNPSLELQIMAMIELNQSVSIHNRCDSCQINVVPTSALTNLYQWECYKEGYILVFTLDKEKNSVINRLTEIYNLSKCEAVCAIQFMHTPSIADIAGNTFRSQETIRNHIKHTMQKMDAHSQAELMKKLIIVSSL
jgi:hypothetical protein